MVAPTIVDKRQEANYLPFKVEASLVDGVADMSVAKLKVFGSNGSKNSG